MILEIFLRTRATVVPVQGLKYFSFYVLQVRSLLMVQWIGHYGDHKY